MTHSKDEIQKVEELGSIFAALNGIEKDRALAILRALKFAQAVICSEHDRDEGADEPAARAG